MKIEELIKMQLNNVVKEQSESHISEEGTYMVLQNLILMKENIEKILSMKNHPNFPKCVTGEHAWAGDHIATSKDDVEEVAGFIGSRCGEDGEQLNEEESIDESKNKPTNPKLWASSLAWAKSKYKVCPSAYCNGAAAKRYKSKGGGWRKKTNESINESKKNDDVYHKTYTSAINTALDYAEKKGYTYDKEEVAREIGMGPRKPKDGSTNRFTISLKKDDKEQKKSLHIQVYGMKETYELNYYIS
jgi:hypothetical protein